MAREVELKLDIEPACASRLAELSFLSEPPARQLQVSVYFDTPKAKLRRNGWILRVRHIGDRYVQTIKRAGEAAGLFDRDEWECEVTGPEPEWRHVCETPLATLLNERQLRSLVPAVRTDVSRSTWKVADKHAAIEICLDEARIEAGDSSEENVELELELIEGDARALLAKAKKIGAHVPVKLGVLAKSERGFALANGTRGVPVKATHVALPKDVSVAEGFTAIINACLKHFRLNEPMLIERRDSEALHQLRVAIRRVRSALWLFRPAVRDSGFKRTSDRLRKFTRELGTARNIDVILASMRPDDPAREQLERDRRLVYGRIIRKLDSKAFCIFILDLLAWTHAGEWRGGKKAGKRLLPFATKRLDRLWRQIENRAADISALSDEELHRLRIDTKKIRYALQFLEEPLQEAGGDQKAFAAAAEGVQDSLGLLNDLATRQKLVANTAEPWLIDRESARLLQVSRRHLRKLAKIGPYWRKVQKSTDKVALARSGKAHRSSPPTETYPA